MKSFDVKGGFETGKMLMDHVEMISLSTSPGNLDSLIQHSASLNEDKRWRLTLFSPN